LQIKNKKAKENKYAHIFSPDRRNKQYCKKDRRKHCQLTEFRIVKHQLTDRQDNRLDSQHRHQHYRGITYIHNWTFRDKTHKETYQQVAVQQQDRRKHKGICK
jgi:hypothetical protein